MIDGASIDAIVPPIVEVFGTLPMVVAMAVGGSTQAGLADSTSDLDLYVFWKSPLAPAMERAAVLARFADGGAVRVDVRSFGLEDWLKVNGRKVEMVYLYFDDLRAQVEQAYAEELDSESFTTSLLYIIAHSAPCYDPAGELARLRTRLQAEYPEATRRALLQRRTPLLRVYLEDLGRDQRRGDLLSAQSGRAGLQAVYFNLLFALNRRYHPGGKRLLIHAERCPIRPADLPVRWATAARLPIDDPMLMVELEMLVTDLLRLIEQHGGLELRAEVW